MKCLTGMSFAFCAGATIGVKPRAASRTAAFFDNNFALIVTGVLLSLGCMFSFDRLLLASRRLRPPLSLIQRQENHL